VSIEPRPGEVWAVDFGLAAKQRPVLILAYPQPEDARALVVVVPLTSQLRGLRGKVDISKPRWLPKRSAVNIQGFAGIDQHALIRKLGRLSDEQFSAVKDAIREMLSPSESGLSRR
jgi:mRNA interferase MazF